MMGVTFHKVMAGLYRFDVNDETFEVHKLRRSDPWQVTRLDSMQTIATFRTLEAVREWAGWKTANVVRLPTGAWVLRPEVVAVHADGLQVVVVLRNGTRVMATRLCDTKPHAEGWANRIGARLLCPDQGGEA